MSKPCAPMTRMCAPMSRARRIRWAARRATGWIARSTASRRPRKSLRSAAPSAATPPMSRRKISRFDAPTPRRDLSGNCAPGVSTPDSSTCSPTISAATFDLILANAVLLHFDRAQLPRVLVKATALNPAGRLAFSLKGGDGEGWSSAKLGAPRYFCYWRAQRIAALLDAAGFARWSIVEAHMNRADADWIYVDATTARPNFLDATGPAWHLTLNFRSIPGPPHDQFRLDECDDRRRDQGGARVEARFRRGGEFAGFREGAGRFRHHRRQEIGKDPVRGTAEGPSRLRLHPRGRRRCRRLRQEPRLAHRPARRHHQFPARPADLRHFHRTGARGADRRRDGLQSRDRRHVHRGKGARRLLQQPPHARRRAPRHGGGPDRHRHPAARPTPRFTRSSRPNWGR